MRVLKFENNPIVAKWNIDKDKLILHLNDCLQVINLEELNYCMSDKGYTTFYLSDGRSFTVSKTLKWYEGQLSYSNFFRTHKSFVVNLNAIDNYNRSGFVLLRDGKEIPVSYRKKEAFLERFLGL